MTTKHVAHQKLQTIWMSFTFVTILALFLSGCGSAPQAKVYHVGILSGLSAFSPAVDGFKAEMTKLGYTEGKNIIYDVQSSDVDTAAYKTAVKKFIDEKVDLIFAFPTEAAMEVKADTQGTNIPVIFTLAFTDVPGVDLIKSISAPGGNITGVRFPSVDIASKRLQILLQIVPTASRVFVPYLKGYPNVPGQLDVIRQQAKTQGVELVEFAATSPQDLQAELDRRVASGDIGFDAILQVAEPLSITPAFYDVLGKFSYANKIPVGGALMDSTGNSSIFGLLPQADVAGQQSALLADKIFKGTPAGTIPVLTSDSYFQINYKATQVFGLTVPEGLLKQADQVIR
ncbi:MAG TPA: ABC transporter substrate-binding protein [Anaerolineales bacterium]|nr:ABC transporter substrate-binding protein [Anaerolineales bacterium]